MATNIDAIASLVEEIQSTVQKLQQPDLHNETSSSTEGARRTLIQAAERLVIAARQPEENLYATASNVRVLITKPFTSLLPDPLPG